MAILDFISTPLITELYPAPSPSRLGALDEHRFSPFIFLGSYFLLIWPFRFKTLLSIRFCFDYLPPSFPRSIISNQLFSQNKWFIPRRRVFVFSLWLHSCPIIDYCSGAKCNKDKKVRALEAQRVSLLLLPSYLHHLDPSVFSLSLQPLAVC